MKLRILMLTPYLPYPDSSGGQIRTQNLLKHLRRKHDITLFSLIKDPKEERYVPILEKNFCKKVRVFRRPAKPWTLHNIISTGFSKKPFLVVRNYSKQAHQAIIKELKDNHYDLIHVETFYAMPHIPKTSTPVVLVDQTIEYQVYRHYVQTAAPTFIRPLLNIDVKKLKHWERYYWRAANKVIAVSKKDKEEMLSTDPSLDVEIVPNGVNLDLFRKKRTWKPKIPKLLFVGNFHWLQNTEAAQVLIQEILPLVKKEIPAAQVIIAGQHQPNHLRALASKSVSIKNLSEDNVQGIVNAYYNADIFVTPLKGPGGTRLKNLAAMATQLPIVSSSVGMSGLGVRDGVHAIVKNNPKEMASSIVRLLQNPMRAKKIARASRRFVERNYDYKVIAKKLSNIYQQVAQQ